MISNTEHEKAEMLRIEYNQVRNPAIAFMYVRRNCSVVEAGSAFILVGWIWDPGGQNLQE
jgi:hypothetical protein